MDFSLQNINAEQPSLWSVAYVLMLTFGLTTCIAIVYHLTSYKKSSTGQFIQTLILGAIGAAIIVLAIGDSVGRGLGILGALAIIRFRTTLSQQRDIVFVFCSLGIGMACGMYGFNIAVAGTALFCLLALLFRFTPLNGFPEIIHRVRIHIPLQSIVSNKEIESVFNQNKLKFNLIRTEFARDAKANFKEYTYLISNVTNQAILIAELNALDQDAHVRLWSRFENEND